MVNASLCTKRSATRLVFISSPCSRCYARDKNLRGNPYDPFFFSFSLFKKGFCFLERKDAEDHKMSCVWLTQNTFQRWVFRFLNKVFFLYDILHECSAWWVCTMCSALFNAWALALDSPTPNLMCNFPKADVFNLL